MSSPLLSRLKGAIGSETLTLGFALVVVGVTISLLAPRFLSPASIGAAAFQLPELGLLTIAMMLPTLTGGLNLAVTFTANMAGLIVAWTFLAHGGADAGIGAFAIGALLGLIAGGFCGWVMGAVIAYTGSHPILISLAMMIFLRGFGEFVTGGADISNFPPFLSYIGYGSVGVVPVPLLILVACLIVTHLLLSRTKLGFAIYMVGSNPEAARFSGINTKKVIMIVYTLSGVICAIAGILMLARFNSIRVGHGESYILVTVLACFLGNVDPHGGFGRVLPVALGLVILQMLSSGVNILGANQHLATAIWGFLLIGVMALRWSASKIGELRSQRKAARTREAQVGSGTRSPILG